MIFHTDRILWRILRILKGSSEGSFQSWATSRTSKSPTSWTSPEKFPTFSRSSPRLRHTDGILSRILQIPRGIARILRDLFFCSLRTTAKSRLIVAIPISTHFFTFGIYFPFPFACSFAFFVVVVVVVVGLMAVCCFGWLRANWLVSPIVQLSLNRFKKRKLSLSIDLSIPVWRLDFHYFHQSITRRQRLERLEHPEHLPMRRKILKEPSMTSKYPSGILSRDIRKVRLG